MKLADLKVDSRLVEDGDWVDSIPEMEDLRLKVRGVGNVDWRKIQRKLIRQVPQHKRVDGMIPEDEEDRITSICLQSACLLDWDGLVGDDDKPIPYSKDMAGDLLTMPETRAFRDAVLWAATIVGRRKAAATEADAKN